MTGRARLFTLVAQKEALTLATLARHMQQAQGDLQEAEAMLQRLHRLMDELSLCAGVTPVAALQNRGMMLARLAAEVVRLQDRASHARIRIADLRVKMIAHDQRRRSGTEAALAAKQAEADLAEARLDAGRPAPRAAAAGGSYGGSYGGGGGHVAAGQR
jgi:chromosome segregation ATPase